MLDYSIRRVKGYMTDDMMVKAVALDGSVLSEGKPSSEMKMHP